MIYVVSFVILVFVVLNLYASWKVLRDGLSTKTQKLMQLGFVWLLPIFGAVLAVNLIGGMRHPSMDFEPKRMDIEDYWRYGLDGCDQSQTGHSHSSDHSCD